MTFYDLTQPDPINLLEEINHNLTVLIALQLRNFHQDVNPH